MQTTTMQVNICILLLCIGVSGGSATIHQLLFLNETSAEVCFKVAEEPISVGEEAKVSASVELVLNVAYASAVASAGYTEISFDSASIERQYLRYEHHVTNMTHDLRVWLNDEEMPFIKAKSPRWYYMSKFLDVLVVADGTIDFRCSHKNITETILLEEKEQTQSHPNYDYNDIELLGTQTNVEEATITSLAEDQFVNQNASMDPNAELLSINFTEFSRLSPLETEAEYIDDSLLNPATDIIIKSIPTTTTTEESITEISNSYDSKVDDLIDVSINEDSTVIESVEIISTLVDNSTESAVIHRFEMSESTEDATTEVSGNLPIQETTDIGTVLFNDLVDSEEVLSTYVDENNKQIIASFPENITEFSDAESSGPISTKDDKKSDHTASLNPQREIQIDENFSDTTLLEDPMDPSFARSHGDEQKDNDKKIQKPHMATVYALAFVLGGLFVIALVISVAFHRKKKKLNMEMATRAVRSDKLGSSGETERFIKISQGL